MYEYTDKKCFILIRTHDIQDQKVIGKTSVKNMKDVDYDANASKESNLFCFTIVTKKKENLTFACKRNDECDEWIKM